MEQKVDPARVNIPIKHEFEHVDHTDPEHTLDGDMKEPLPAIPAPLGAPERLTIVQAFRKYPWPAFLCFLGAFSAISDGYQIQMSGSIIALPGFIIQFGSPQRPSGKYVLDPYNVAIWGGTLFRYQRQRSVQSLIPSVYSHEVGLFDRRCRPGDLAKRPLRTEAHDLVHPDRFHWCMPARDVCHQA